MNVDEAMAIGRKEKPDWYFNANEAAPILAAEVERLRAELAAAKAASGWPAGYTEIRTNPGGNVVIYTENHENAYRLIAWLRDRMKERGEG